MNVHHEEFTRTIVGVRRLVMGLADRVTILEARLKHAEDLLNDKAGAPQDLFACTPEDDMRTPEDMVVVLDDPIHETWARFLRGHICLGTLLGKEHIEEGLKQHESYFMYRGNITGDDE
jgi:hypothetical protein